MIRPIKSGVLELLQIGDLGFSNSMKIWNIFVG